VAVELWRPTRARADASTIEAFRRAAELRHRLTLPDYDALHAWSVERPHDFWSFAAEWLRLPLHGAPTVVRSADPMPHTRWFEGVTLNYAEALLYPAGLESSDAPALIGVVESGAEERYSYAELRAEVARAQLALRAGGIGHGDAVVAFTANVPAAVVLLLACAGLGVRLATCSPDFGAAAAYARFGQLRPKALFASCGYAYGGRWFDTTVAVSELAGLLSRRGAIDDGGSLGVVALPYPGHDHPAPNGVTAWSEWLATGAPGSAGEPTLVPLPFDEPLSVLFSSGTTGKPKAMVHRAGGLLLTHAKEHALHCDIRPGDVVFYFTTCGWMMWNWLVSSLAQAATALLYDGSPAFPDQLAPFALAERYAVSFFGTSARFIHSVQAAGLVPAREHDLAGIRTVASTGSPLSPSGFEYVYSHVGADVHLASISGGTDIVGCFMLGVPTLPVHAGQIQRPGLGVDLAVFDPSGRPLRGEPGELVCRQALPSMPLSFLDDPDHARYSASYLERFPGVWCHGDTIELTAEGGIVVHGRSDTTLNPGGVRIGTAEVYRALEVVPEVIEAAAVGKKTGGGTGASNTDHTDEEVWLLVVLRDGVALDDDLVERIRAAVRANASPRHVPRRVLRVADLPRTRSGKLMEKLVGRLVNRLEPDDVAAVANPDSLESVRQAVALSP